MAYPYLGNQTRTYPQYRDATTWLPLVAEPGGTYSMAPVAGADGVPVPPGDGLWGLAAADAALPADAPAETEDPQATPRAAKKTAKAAPPAEGE